MNVDNEKCVIVIDESLPLGIIANTAAILGITMGMKMPDVVGNDVLDLEGNPHMGIIQFPVPILKGNTEILKTLRTKLFEPQFTELTVVDFSDLAQGCKTYDEFIGKMSNTSEIKLNLSQCEELGDLIGFPIKEYYVCSDEGECLSLIHI